MVGANMAMLRSIQGSDSAHPRMCRTVVGAGSPSAGWQRERAGEMLHDCPTGAALPTRLVAWKSRNAAGRWAGNGSHCRLGEVTATLVPVIVVPLASAGGDVSALLLAKLMMGTAFAAYGTVKPSSATVASRTDLHRPSPVVGAARQASRVVRSASFRSAAARAPAGCSPAPPQHAAPLGPPLCPASAAPPSADATGLPALLRVPDAQHLAARALVDAAGNMLPAMRQE